MGSRPHILVVDAFESLMAYVKSHPLQGGGLCVVLFVIVLMILKRVFGRIAGDIVFFALIITAIVLIFGSSALTFFHVKGLPFGH